MSDAAEAPRKLAWLDVETRGLTAGEDALLEVGWRITDLDLNTIGQKRWLLWDTGIATRLNHMSAFVRDMHTKNNLLMEARAFGQPVDYVWRDMVDWLQGDMDITSEGKLPISGSSVSMDVAFLNHFLPDIAAQFHYRIIDNSTVKELCRRYNPELYAQRTELETDHRVFTCLDATIHEARFYLDNFIFDGRTDNLEEVMDH